MHAIARTLANVVIIFLCASLRPSLSGQEITCTLFRNDGTPQANESVVVDVKARSGATGNPRAVPQASMRLRDPASGTTATLAALSASSFAVITDATGSFTLLFNQGGVGSFPRGENQLDITIEGDGNIAAEVRQLATDQPHDFSVVLNGIVLAGSRALGGTGLVQSFSIASADFLLTGDRGTASFQMRLPGRRAQYRVQALELAGGSEEYVFYRESDSEARWWAFAKAPSTVCMCINGRWVLVRDRYRIYYWNRGVSKKWTFLGFGRAKNPVREMRGDQ